MPDSRQIVRDYAEAFSRGDIDAVCALFSPDAVIHGVFDGRLNSAREAWSNLISAFGITLEIEALCVEGEVVVARYIERGTFNAPFRGFSPTGRSYEVDAIHWFEIADGKIIRRWGARCTASIARQIGITTNDVYEA